VSIYPEKIPENLSSIDVFPFSFSAARSAKKEISSQLEQINSRIQKIVDHFVYDDIPILHFVMRATNKKADLKQLSKALDRLADLVEIQSDLISRSNVLSLLETDPTWFTTTFSDYSSEINDDLDLFNFDNE